MSNNGHVQITHELLRSDEYLSAPADQCKVLITIFDRACFAPCTMNDHGVQIHLKPGQLMTTYRELAKLSGTDRKVVERTINRFLTCGILGQEVRHKKTILTILWGIKTECSGTRNGTRMGQERDIKEEDKKTNDDDLIDIACEARIEKIEGEDKMDALVIVNKGSRYKVMTMRESQIFAELEPLGYTREAIREAIKVMIEYNPILNHNAKMTNYIKSILEKKVSTPKKEKTHGKDSSKRPSQQDSLRRTRETITRSSVREPCYT